MRALSKSARMVSSVCGLAFLIAAQLAPARGAPTIVQGHYEEVIKQTCNTSSFCEAQFSSVPAGELLVVTSTSCLITYTINTGLTGLSQVYLQSVGYAGGPFSLTPTVMAAFPGHGSIQASAASISKVYQAGAQPVIVVELTNQPSTHSLTCSIFGTITP